MTTYLQKQAQNKSKTLSKILGIDRHNVLNNSSSSPSSPDLELIIKLKEKAQTNDPMLRLSMEDYELMCKNKVVFNMMVRVLKTDANKLKKVCKHLGIFKEHINSSPETIKNKMKAEKAKKALKAPIFKLPEDLRSKIVDIFYSIQRTKHILRKGIPFDKLEKESLSSNPNAIDFLLENPHLIHWGNLSGNPNATHLLEVKMEDEAKLSKDELANIPRDKKLDWRELSGNPNAIKLIYAKYMKEQASPDDVYVPFTFFTHLDWRKLSNNPNPEAEVLLRAPENIQGLTWNPPAGAAGAGAAAEPVNLQGITAEQDDIGFVNSKIRGWANLSLNPDAIKLLVKRIAYEKELPEDQYKKIIRVNKINWYFITINPAIFI